MKDGLKHIKMVLRIYGKSLCYLLMFIVVTNGFSQDNSTDSQDHLVNLNASISEQLKAPIQDSVKFYNNMHKAIQLAKQKNSDFQLAKSYQNLAIWHSTNVSTDSSLHYYKKVLTIYKQSDSLQLKAETHLALEDVHKQRGEYLEAMTQDYKALELYEKLNNESGIAKTYTRLCDILYYQEKFEEGADYCQKAIDVQKRLDEPIELSISYRFKADNLLILERYDDALLNINNAIDILKKANVEESEIAPNYNTRGNIYKYLKQFDKAISEYEKCYQLAITQNYTRGIISSLGNLGHVYRLQDKHEEAIPFFIQAIDVIKKTGSSQNLFENYLHAARSYEAIGQMDKAIEFQRLYAEERFESLQQIIDQQETELQIKYETAKKDETIEVQDAQIDRQRRIQLLYIGIALLLTVMLLTMLFYLKNMRKKREALALLNNELAKKQDALEASNSKLKTSLDELKSTQDQLIQSEKMASLGELTAGIAHEIQNPLNFVNNFSEVSHELIEEMNEEIDQENYEDVKDIANDIKQNLEKITHHGKRADSIVKGMLQHSRNSDDIKEPTNINTLTDEYTRLAYHGLRAKDKSFNATIDTYFDDTISDINIVPQEIGRVILNLLTNAFYAVNEKKLSVTDSEYKPTVSVHTKKTPKHIEIKVKDNGNGIPTEALNKIFEPFFTTKPTGQGTGLGLSMSYDIIKSHGGTLEVNTEKGTYSEFKIILPIKTKST